MNKVKVEDGQTLFDIAIQEMGTIEAMFHIVSKNNQIASVSSNLRDGAIVLYDKTNEIANQAIRSWYIENGYRPRTGKENQKQIIDDGGLDDVLVVYDIIDDGGLDDVLLSYGTIKNSNTE
jgi:hypothetical protein